MNPDYEKQLADEIDRELKGLPELTAPESLGSRVLATLARRVSLPWYRRAWQTWPVGLQAGALGFLVVVLVAACFGAWELSQSPVLAVGLQKAQAAASPLLGILNALNTLLGVLVLAVKQLSTGILLSAVAAVALAWAACVGLGTVYFRLAFARR